MAWKPVPLPDGSYADASKPFSDQDVVNLWVEYAEGEGTRSPKKLVQLPGLRPFADFGAGPHRAIRNVEGNLFLVADTHAYQVALDGTATQLGTIPGRGRVWISHNQITNGAEVMFSTGPDAWIWNTVTQTFTKVTDEAFRGARSLIYLNSRFLGIEQQRRFFANSALADGQSWDSLERYEAESAPDRLVALIDYGGEVYAFNERTLEIFQNTTNPEDIANHILFTRIGSPVEIGAASPHAVSRLDNRIFLVSSKGGGYYMSGYTPVCITTPAIETAWQGCDLSKAFCFTYESRGHAIWYVTFPDGHTWGYDCLSSARAGRPIWHRRETIGLNRWRLNTLVAWNGGWYGGAYNSGILYQLDWDYEGLEGCDEIDRYFIPGVLHDEGNRVTLNGLRLECDTGYGTTECVSVEPQDFGVYVAAFGDIAAGNPGNYVYSGLLEGPRVEETTDFDTTAEAISGVAKIGNKVWFTGNLAGTDLWEATLPDLTTWTVRTLAHSSVNALHSNGTNKLVTVKNAFPDSVNVGYSSDGATWAGVNVPGIYMGMVSKHTLTYGGGYWGFVGYDDANAPTEGNVAFSSTGSSGWVVSTIDAGTDPFCSLVYTGSAWIACRGNGEIWRSTDRSAWTKVSDAGEIFTADYPAKFIASDGAGKVLAGGWDGVFGNNPTFGYSDDHGVTWTDVSAGFTGDKLYAHIAYLDGYFYTGAHRTATGSTWEAFDLTDGPGFGTSAARFDGLIEYTP